MQLIVIFPRAVRLAGHNNRCCLSHKGVGGQFPNILQCLVTIYQHTLSNIPEVFNLPFHVQYTCRNVSA